MTQTLDPSSDVAGDFSIYGGEATYWETVNNDSLLKYIYGVGNNDYATVGLEAGDDPQVGTNHTVYWTWASLRDSVPPEKATLQLLEDGDLIATLADNVTMPTTVTDDDYTLSEAEANSITDYSALQVKIIADTVGSNEQIQLYQTYMEIPDAPAPGGPASNLMLLGVG